MLSIIQDDMSNCFKHPSLPDVSWWCHSVRTGNGSRPSLMTKPSMRCVRTWVVCILSGLRGALVGEEGGWLGPLTAAGRTGGGREGDGGGGVLVVSREDSSTTGDLIIERLGVMEGEPITAEQQQGYKRQRKKDYQLYSSLFSGHSVS